MKTKQLPNSLEAEKGFLGSVLLNPAILEKSQPSSDVFYLHAHRAIYEAILQMMQRAMPIDLVSVTQYLEDQKILSKVGGPGLITDLVTFTPTAANADHYLRIIKEKLWRRTVINECSQIELSAYEASDFDDMKNRLADAEQKIASLRLADSTHPTDDRELLMEYVNTLERAANGEITSTLSTPFETINKRAGGTGPGEVTGIVGLPSAGKSVLGKQFLLHYLREHGIPSVVFTAEMPYQQWMNRLVCEMGQISYKNLRQGRLNTYEQKSMSSTIMAISKMPLYVYDRKRIRFTKDAIESTIRREAKQHGAKVVLLDYLQMVEVSRRGKKELRTDEEIGLVSKMLKDMAVTFGMHVFALCAESDEGKIRSSREPEYDFDNILKLCVKQEKNPKNGAPMIITDRVLVSKWRDAERGYNIYVEMDGEHCMFKDVTGTRNS